MILTDAEEEMVRRLRKKQVHMHYLRWWLLLCSISVLGLSAYCAWLLAHNFQKREPDLVSVMMIAMYLPKIYFSMSLGGLILIYTRWNWNGSPQDKLLLRLIDESRKT